MLISALATQLLCPLYIWKSPAKGPKWELRHLALRALKFHGTEAQMALRLPAFFPLTPSGLQFLGGALGEAVRGISTGPVLWPAARAVRLSPLENFPLLQ